MGRRKGNGAGGGGGARGRGLVDALTIRFLGNRNDVRASLVTE